MTKAEYDKEESRFLHLVTLCCENMPLEVTDPKFKQGIKTLVSLNEGWKTLRREHKHKFYEKQTQTEETSSKVAQDS